MRTVASSVLMRPWLGPNRSCDHQDSLSLLGEEQELNATTAAKCEAYVCSLFTASKKTSTADELHYFMFCQKKQKNEMLPPTSDCLLQHLKRANYQAFLWKHALEAMQDLDSLEGHGWVRDRELIVPLLITKSPAPESLLEADDVQVENLSVLAKLLLQQRRTCFSALKGATAWPTMMPAKTCTV